MRFATLLLLPTVILVAIACSGAFASEPGQPLDCSDWVFLEPGYTCHEWKLCDPAVCSLGTQTRMIDTSGALLYVDQVSLGASCGVTPLRRTRVLRETRSETVVLGYIDDRCVAPSGVHGEVVDYLYIATSAPVQFDAVAGTLRTMLGSFNAGGDYGGRWWIVAVDGFGPLFDILQSFTPPSSVGFHVPAMPEGLPAADHFDTYWGPLAHPIDFTQAHALQCGYPAAAPPHVGDYLTVADTLPNPEPGTGRYYVTAATYQWQKRYGRKTTAGHLSGRDPAVLPPCGP